MFKFLNRSTSIFLGLYLYTIFSGALRKWVFVNQFAVGNIIFLGQLLFPFTFLFLTKQKAGFAPFRNNIVNFYVFAIALMAINPLNLTISHGIIGMIIHFGFWYMCFYYIENRDEFEINQLIPIFVGVGFFMLVLASIQYQLPPRHFLNRYADETKVGNDIALVGDSVRVTGTFSYLGGFTSYLILHILLVWALVKKLFSPPITLTLLMFGLIGAFMSGSRTTTYSYLGFSSLIVITEFVNFNFARFLGRLIPAALMIYMFILLKGQLGVEEGAFKAYENFENRRIELKESGEEKKRLFWDFNDLFVDYRGKYPWFGVGLGSTYQGATAIFGTSDYVIEFGYYENELTRVVLEGGFVLLAIKLLMCLYLVSRLYIPFLGKCAIFAFTSSIFIQIVFNVYFSAFLFLGIVLLDNMYYQAKQKKSV